MQNLRVSLKLSITSRSKVLLKFVRNASRELKNADHQKESVTMKVLNVAEKNDAAKNIAIQLSRSAFTRREGQSKYNKIYEFHSNLWNRNCKMVMTSVSGHLLTYEFYSSHRPWQSCQPYALFDAPVKKTCSDDFKHIKDTIQREVRSCDALIIWTDCDREGENIGFEIIQICKEIKPDIPVYRAKFSEITHQSVTRALNTLEAPNKAVSDAVDVRSELDLRIGAAFTRFQTLRLQKVFPCNLSDMLISYGSCQFPTLGFVVERFLAIERFRPEIYWKIRVLDERDNLSVEFRWARSRLFEKLPCQIFLDICHENPPATVEKIVSKPKSKWRPLPLDTVELEKQGSRKLHMNAKETMKVAEKLYTQGYISYPRTETNIFPKEFNLTALVEMQKEDCKWGQFAQRVLIDGINPRRGKKSDEAHPPIHPTKYVNHLQGNEARLYEYVVRHFLACMSKDAQGYETVVDIDIAGEKFTTSGLHIIAKNYLEVFIYEKWNAKEIHLYQEGQTFNASTIDMVEEKTSPPNLLSEADLIALMDKHGIGTDATHAEHIETIKSRHYVGLKDNKYLIPGKLGIGLVMGYDKMGFEQSMSKPNLRAELESDLKLICEGRKNPQDVLQSQITKYREVFREAFIKANLIDQTLAEWLDERPAALTAIETTAQIEEAVVFKCPKCDSAMMLKVTAEGTRRYIGCSKYPECRNSIWFPKDVKEVNVLNEVCNKCTSGNFMKIALKLSPNVYPIFGSSYISCVGGCDSLFSETFKIARDKVQQIPTSNDSAYGSSLSSNKSQQPPYDNTSHSVAISQSPYSSATNANNFDVIHLKSQVNPSSSNLSLVNSTSNSWNNGRSSRSTNLNSFGITMIGSVNRTGGNDNGGDIVCNCHLPARRLTVRKEGPNLGRQFYKCPNSSGSDCSFFLWATDGPEQYNSTQTRQIHQGGSGSKNGYSGPHSNVSDSDGNSDPVTMCNCKLNVKRLTVNKEGPNKGRQFYTCAKGIGEGCNFFQWSKDEKDNVNYSGDWGKPPPPLPPGLGRRRVRKGGESSRGRGSFEDKTERKCSTCGQAGHTKKTCGR